MKLHVGSTFPFTVATIAAGALACWPTLRSLAAYWEDGAALTYTHGYAVAAISVWLIWRARNTIDAVGPRPCWPALVITALLGFAWYSALVSGFETGHWVLFPFVLLAACLSVVGLPATAAVAFAICYLYFAVPVWSMANDILRSVATFGIELLTRVTGLPAYVEGNEVHIAAGTFEIAGGCSGLRFFIMALAVAALYGELSRLRFRDRLKLLAIAGVMAILMNWVRAYGVILDGHLTDMKGYLVAKDHYMFGLALFGLLVLAFAWLAPRIAKPVDAPDRAVPSAPVAGSRRSGIAFVAALAALSIGPALVAAADYRADSAPGAEVSLPGGSGGWNGPTLDASSWFPVFPMADSEAIGHYDRNGARVAAYLNAYTYQAQGKELIAQGNSVLGEPGWRSDTSRIAVARGQGDAISYREDVAAAPNGERWVIAYVYVVGERTFTRPMLSKLYYGTAALQGHSRSGVVAVAARCGVDCSDAKATVSHFMSSNAWRLLDSMRGRRA